MFHKIPVDQITVRRGELTMRKLMALAIVVVLVLTAFATAAPVQAQGKGATITRIPVSGAFFVPCADGGAGEVVVWNSGYNHIVWHHVTDGNGGSHDQPIISTFQGATAIGQTTGDTYRAVNVFTSTRNSSSGLSYEFTTVSSIRLIGPGPGNNFQAHFTLHFTFNANGEVTAEVISNSVTCK